jgi:signal transduction histidine kinase
MLDKPLHQLQQSTNRALKQESPLGDGFSSLDTKAPQNTHLRVQENLKSVNEDLEKRKVESNYLLQAVLKNIAEAIVFISLEGKILTMNERAIKLLDLKLTQDLFVSYWTLFNDDFFGFSMREALKFGISHKILYKSHPPKEFEISTFLLYGGAKETHGLMILFQDISERQKLHLLANRADKMKELGEMSAVIAHEIRNPLGGIRGYASLLYRDLAQEPHLQEMASLIVEGTKQLEKLVSSILHYARPIHIEPRSIDLGTFLRNLIRFVKVDPMFPKNVHLFSHIPNDPLLVPIDPDALKSALLNLIFNALQAMPEGGDLTLSLLKQTHCCQISVSDTGIGMEDILLKQLFSPFFTTKQKGNGLGLVEVQKIIQAHLGTIEVRSTLHKGSTFTINLPLRRS